MADPTFVLVGTNPFGLADVGANARLVLADLDGDGDLDALIGYSRGNTLFFRNAGTTAAPTFTLAGTDPFGLADVGEHATPVLADVDGDGDRDALFGNRTGDTLFFRNTGTAGAPTFSLAGTNPFGLANVAGNGYAAPALVDVDGDGDLDALIGNRAGNTVFFRNTGTAGAPTFTLAGTNPFGLADAGSNASPMLVDMDDDGDLDALIGNDDGNTIFFRNTGSSDSPTFTRVGTNPFGLADVGSRSNPTLADIDGDGDLDAVIGNSNGDTVIFNNGPLPVPGAPTELDLTAASDAGSSSTDNRTNDATPTVTGAVSTAATVVLYDGATAVGTATASGTGAWTITSASLSDGAHTLTAIAGNAHGTSPASSALTVTVDTAAPTLSSAAVSGATLTLTYDEALDGGSDPAASAYTVTVGGAPVTVSGVDADGTTVTLTLATAVTQGQTVTLDYTAPGTAPVQDTAGNQAAALSGQAVTATGDATAPTLSSAVVNGATLTLTYDEVLNGTADPAASAYTVTAGGSPVAVSGVNVDGATVTLTLASAVTRGQTVTLDYTVPGTAPVQDMAGNSAAALTTQAAVNRTAGNPSFTLLGTSPFGLADAGTSAMPVLADLDGDGDLDALIGNSSGNTLFFRNTGTTAAPTFSLAGTNPFGLADVGEYAAPVLEDVDGDGDRDALIGNKLGDTLFFRNTGTAGAPTFTLTGTNPFGLANVAGNGYAAPALVDVDGDGDLDAFIGNRTGNTLFFRNTGAAGAPAFSLTGTNPFGLADAGTNASPKLVDVDGDGDLDALIGNDDGNALYFRNTGAAGAPTFTLVSTNPFGLADVGSRSNPALADIDGDGDLDALIGNSNGDTVVFQDGPLLVPGVPTGLDLAAASDNGSSSTDDRTNDATPTVTGAVNTAATVVLYDGATAVGTATASGAGAWTITSASLSDGAHTLTAIAGNADGTSPASSALTVTVDTAAPTLSLAVVDGATLTLTYDEALNGTADPAASAYTVTAGGAPVTVSSVDASGTTVTLTLATAVAQGQTVTLDYAAPGSSPVQDTAGNSAAALTTQTVVNRTAGNPSFTLLATNLFGLANVGANAMPVLADMDGDGDLDALAGNGSGNTLFFRNTGTTAAPAFSLAGTNPFGLADVGDYAAPVLEDVDGDGARDALIGNKDGDTLFFRNTGTTGAPTFTLAGTNPFGLDNVGDYAAPALVDVDGDGDLDAFIGNKAGNTLFFRNTGTAGAPTFSLAGTNPFGLADVGNNAKPMLVDVDGDGGIDALIGNNDGNTIFFRNTGSSEVPTFTRVGTNPFDLADVGIRSNPTLADLDGDGDLDAFIGNFAGDTVVFNNGPLPVPGAPTGLDVAAASDSGSSSTDDRTNDATPTVTGTVGTFGTVVLYDGATAVGTATASGAGAWTITSASLSDGAHTLTAIASNAGGTSPASSALTVTVDTTAPAAPTGLALTAGSNSGSTSDTLTSDTTPTITGTVAEAGTVILYDGAVAVGTATASGAGAWTVTASSLSEAAHTLTAVAVDAAGNTSQASGTVAVTIDITATVPAGLALAAGSNSGSTADALTNVATPVITGTVNEAGTVVLYDGTTAIGTASASGAGAWTITAASLSDAAHTLTAVAVDAAGNTSQASSPLTVTIDTTAHAPTGLALSAATNGGSTADTLTNAAAPTITGTAAEAATIVLYDGTGAVGTATASGAGAWTITSASLSDAAHTLTAVAVDAAGNTSAASSGLTITIDTAVSAPTGVDLATGSDSGPSSSDELTSVTTPTLTGSVGEAATVILYDGVAAVGTALVSGAGTWTITAASLSDAAHTLTAVAIDAAGNTSQPSGTLTVTIDTAAPAAPAGLALTAASNSGSTADTLTNATAPTITGSVAEAATIVLYDGGTAVGTATATGAGAWTITSAGLSATTHSLTAVAIDAAGNTSQASTTLEVTIDTTSGAPSGLVLTAASNSGSTADTLTNATTPTVTGSVAEAATIVLYDGVTAVGTASASGVGAWTITAASLTDAAHTLTAVAVDAAGNTSQASGSLSVTIDTAVDAPTGLTLAASSNSGSTADTLTSVATPTISGSVAEAGTVILYEGVTAVGTASASGAGAWTITASSLSDAAHTLTAVAIDAAGNTSQASGGLAVTIDTVAPALLVRSPADDATGVAIASGLVLTFDEDVQAGNGALTLRTGGGAVVESFAPDSARIAYDGRAVTITPTSALSHGTTYYLEVASGAFVDAAGNGFAGLSGDQAYNFVTASPPPSPPPPQDDTPPATSTQTVDGVVVQQVTQTTADGTVTQTLTVPIVTSQRTDADARTSNADIPLAANTAGQPVLEASLPVGVGLQVEAVTTTVNQPGTTQGVAGLLRAIESRTQDKPEDKDRMTTVGETFVKELPQSVELTVRTIVPVVADPTAPPSQPIVITGTSSTPAAGGNAGQQQAVVIDVRNLPKGTVIQLQNVEFAAIVGDVQVTGGEGSQMVVGDSGNQIIVLGADDDTLRGGGGDDFVGSQGGDDVLFGDTGSDTVTGGIGNDALYGNQQNDVVYGNQGGDTLFGGQDLDTLFGGQDGDTLYGNLGADVLYGNLGNDTLFGGQSGDTLFGGQGGDALFGNLGGDALFGNLGADTLDGGDGADTLAGGDGADVFRIAAPADGGDVVTDFQTGVDKIAVVSPNFGTLAVGTLPAGHFALDNPTTANATFVFNTRTGVLSFDADGSGAGAAVTIATLNVRTLGHADILVLPGGS